MIRSGAITAFHLFDIAEADELQKVGDLLGPAVPARLAPRPVTPAHVQYQQAPL